MSLMIRSVIVAWSVLAATLGAQPTRAPAPARGAIGRARMTTLLPRVSCALSRTKFELRKRGVLLIRARRLERKGRNGDASR